jgi:hypothetical protein
MSLFSFKIAIMDIQHSLEWENTIVGTKNCCGTNVAFLIMGIMYWLGWIRNALLNAKQWFRFQYIILETQHQSVLNTMTLDILN